MTVERTARPNRSRQGGVQDRMDTLAQVVLLVWSHKLWWLVPVLVCLALLGLLVALQATPVGPLLYPVF